MKTPDEIKKGLECCFPSDEPDCFECPYRRVDRCVSTRMDDTLAYIQQLEAAQPKWISVEKPPKQEGMYIVRAITFNDAIINDWDIFTTGSGWCGEDRDFKKILFYMSFDSLPEPPKEEK